MADNQEDENLTQEEIEEADQAEQEAFEEEQLLNKERYENNIRSRFKAMKRIYMAKSKFWPILGFNELKLLNAMRKIDPGEVSAFFKIVAQKHGEFAAKINSILATVVPLLPYIGIALLIILAVLMVIGIIIGIFNTLGGLGGGSSGGLSSPLGMKGDMFYGMRVFYEDAEQASQDLQRDYADSFSYALEEFKKDYSDITINITVPEEFDLETLEQDYPEVYEAVKRIAIEVYVQDNPDISREEIPDELKEIILGIKYFGIDEEILDEISQSLTDYITDETAPLFTAGEEVTDAEDTILQSLLESFTEVYVLQDENGEKLPSRTQMIYVKDYLLSADSESEEYSINNVDFENYIAAIIMPKEQVKANLLSFNAKNIDIENFNMYLMGETEFDKKLFLEGKYTEGAGDIYNFELEEDLTLEPFADIDSTSSAENNPLKDAKSLWGVLKDANLNAQFYMQLGEDGIYTLKLSGLFITFSGNEEAFSFAEFQPSYSQN